MSDKNFKAIDLDTLHGVTGGDFAGFTRRLRQNVTNTATHAGRSLYSAGSAVSNTLQGNYLGASADVQRSISEGRSTVQHAGKTVQDAVMPAPGEGLFD